MREQISREDIEKILQANDITKLSYSKLTQLFKNEKKVAANAPDGTYQIDPRNSELILYSPGRTNRPHDNDSSRTTPQCAICQGDTTGVVDVAELSEGFTFINKNLYPILFPSTANPNLVIPSLNDILSFRHKEELANGFHFVQWTSSFHNRDWHNIPKPDCVVVIERLATLEGHLLELASKATPEINSPKDQEERQAFVSIIKNKGRLVGGSLDHGHQQVTFGNLMPRRILENMRFEAMNGMRFAEHMLQENPSQLMLIDYGPAILLVPYFMRRPYDMMLILKDTSKRYLHELDTEEVEAVADGWHDALGAIHRILPEMSREIAYNVITHNGSGAGLYFEFLPYSQETGGFEQLGLSVCQANTSDVASKIRKLLIDE